MLAPLPYNDDGANADNVAQPRLGALRFVTDAYMERFDSAPSVGRPAMAAFAASNYNYRFDEFRDRMEVYERGRADSANAQTEAEQTRIVAAIRQEALVSPAQLQSRMGKYHDMMDPDAPLQCCGDCGRAEFAFRVNTDGSLAVPYAVCPLVDCDELIAPPALVATEAATPARFRGVRSLFTHVGVTYCVYPALVADLTGTAPSIRMCGPCHVGHKYSPKKTGPFAAAEGHDLGEKSRLNLPKLTLAEQMCVTRTRVLMANVRLPAGGAGAGNYATTTGHAIAFPQDAPATLAAAASMPNVDFVRNSLTVTLMGPEGGERRGSPAVEAALGLTGALHFNFDAVIAHLEAFTGGCRCGACREWGRSCCSWCWCTRCVALRMSKVRRCIACFWSRRGDRRHHRAAVC